MTTTPGSRAALVVVALGVAACAAPHPAWRAAARGLPPELASASALWEGMSLRESPNGDVRDANLAAIVAMADEQYSPVQHLRVGDGYLIGIDCGEWGGALWWVRTDGGEQRCLANANVIAIFGDTSGATVVTGLAHLTLDGGELLHLRADPAWRIDGRTQLPGCPWSVAIVPSDGIVLASRRDVVCWDGVRLSPRSPNLVRR